MSAFTLRIIACVTMLMDHIGFLLSGRYPYLAPLRWIGRISFPLYAFLMVNGFRYTSNRLRYGLRLAIFALVSQLPFANFMNYSDVFYNFNVLFTLLVAFLTVWSTDELRRHPKGKWISFLPTVLVYGLYYFGIISSDYGAKGVLLAMSFYLFDGKWLLMPSMVVSIYHNYLMQIPFSILNLVRGKPYTVSLPNKWGWIQLLSLLSLVPILLYNNKAGIQPKNKIAKKAMQLSFYLFYPVQFLLLKVLLS